MVNIKLARPGRKAEALFSSGGSVPSVGALASFLLAKVQGDIFSRGSGVIRQSPESYNASVAQHRANAVNRLVKKSAYYLRVRCRQTPREVPFAMTSPCVELPVTVVIRSPDIHRARIAR